MSAAHHCSFCAASQSEAALLLAGPKAFICDECVDHAAAAVLEHRHAHPTQAQLNATLGIG